MRIKCFKLPREVCSQVSTIQVFFKQNGEVSYGRARHYQRLNETKKPVFEYHTQSKEYLTEKLKYVLPKIDQHSDLNQRNDDRKLKESSSISKNRRAGSLARLGHLLDVQKVTGSNPVRPTTMRPEIVFQILEIN